MRRTPITLAFLLLCAGPSIGTARTLGQETFDSSALQAELTRLESICDRIGLPDQAQICRHWIPTKRGDVTRLFLPKSDANWKLGAANSSTGSNRAFASWAKHFRKARERYSEGLFQEAQNIAGEDETAAYQLLWRVLRENPDHAQASRILSPLTKTANYVAQPAKGRVPISELGWEARSYSRVDSPHFTLLTRADRKASQKIARQLEQYYVLWSQVFYPFWASPGVLEKRLSGKTTSWPKHDRMVVVLLENRSEYLRVLGVAEDNIGISVGYYNPSAKKSFFYPEKNMDATLYHELTHQLLMEASHIGASASAGQEGGLWMLEGIALYMESLRQNHDFWEVGGRDASRIQTARYRAVRDGFWPEWRNFTSGDINSWKQAGNLAQLYTHAVGLTHAFMHELDGSARQAYLQNVVGIYQGQNQSSELLQQLTKDVSAGDTSKAKDRYQDLMILDDESVLEICESNPSVEEFVLVGSQLRRETWQKLSELKKLSWLDVSFSNITDSDLKWLGEHQSLQRLSLEGTRTTETTVREVSSLRALTELDLSSCQGINDDAIKSLAGNRTIQILWLTNTQVTSQALATLQTMSGLTSVDISGTKITDAQWQKFLSANSRISN